MAGADFGGTVLGRPVVVDAFNDHNRAAEAPWFATRAYDAGADLLMDVQNSPVAAAVAKVAPPRRKLTGSTGWGHPPHTPAAPRPLLGGFLYQSGVKCCVQKMPNWA